MEGLKLNFLEKVKTNKVTLVEWNTPSTLETTKFFEGAKALSDLKIDKLSIADNPLGMARISNLLLGYQLSERGIPAIIHLTTRDYNLVGLESQLMGLSSVGLNDLMVVKGDPARTEGASNVYDKTAKQLISAIKKMNSGTSLSGRQLNAKTHFKVGGAFNINAENLELEFEDIKRKIAAGADFIITQSVFEIEKATQLKTWLDTNDISIPIFVSIMPVLSFERAQFIQENVQGIELTDLFMDTMRQAALTGEEREIGIMNSRKIMKEISKVFNGIHLVTPGSDYQAIIEIIEGK